MKVFPLNQSQNLNLLLQAILSAIVPSNIKDITPSCLEVMKILGNEFDNWVHTALIEMPLEVLEHKIKGSVHNLLTFHSETELCPSVVL